MIGSPSNKRNGNALPQRLIILALFAALAIVAVATACSLREGISPLELQAQGLNEAIMCPVCPGESIDQSRNPLAIQMRGIVVDKLEQGWSGDQIKDFFVERYGPSVLLSPPREGFSLAVWVVPPIVLIGAGISLYLVLKLMRGPRTVQPRRLEETEQLTDDERDEYFSRIESALGNGGAETSSSDEKDDSGTDTQVQDSNQRSD